jgi:hypothetical protein
VSPAVRATRWLANHGASLREAHRKYGVWPQTIIRHWRRLYPDRRTPYRAETDAVRASVLQQIGRRPRRAAEIFVAVRDDYGSVGERRLWRAIEWLVANGKAARVGPSGKSEGYVLP